ncbi:histidine--tRNA ligase [Pseudothermotoga thermarum]|uniref:Histidine--tRNA ligase n=1 Tax=Pseudothermotoga thermarum DSM 5069 TaxID=688269 RepID=F7YX60_9THEM|nr:histidine--tRNA ligase [Pseudothermotoga thermarum]AEH50998.1 histidyl-tRNA synthetase [Pseudothermotoga thermarum DSM 5069]
MKYERIKGTNDIYGDEIHFWNFVEQKAKRIANLFGYEEIRTPIFEMTELFTRSVGEETDIVQKEMYTFVDKGGRSITLRPEGTAPTMRAFIENSMINNGLPQRFFYIGPMFRYEKPQSGRLRQFHQFGVELLGSSHPLADAEVLILAKSFLEELGIKNYQIHLNSIGCSECRVNYKRALKDYYSKHYDQLCDDCKRRFETNVMRLLDCKVDVQLAANAPKTVDYLCKECKEHYEKLKELLNLAGVDYVEDGNLVRGLDYYTRTVFEVRHSLLGAQNTILAGGRYDGLSTELRGPDLPALGFAAGIERLIIALKSEKVEIPRKPLCLVYVIPLGEASLRHVFEITSQLRKVGIPTIMDVNARNLKAQLKHADRLNAVIAVILGENEVSRNVVLIKELDTSQQHEVQFEYAVDYIVDMLKFKGLLSGEHS